ncbi:MAG: cupin domain-containing protein [Emticicia sp.]|nr:cupin domain-containing protein [Emticicia sp.]
MKRRNFIQKYIDSFSCGKCGNTYCCTKTNATQKRVQSKASRTRYKDKIVYGNIPVDFKLLNYGDTEGRLSIFISTNNQKGFGPPLHIHYTFDEFFCVLKEVLFQLGDEIIPLDKGDTIFIPRNVKHSFSYDGETSGTLLVGITPAKGMEKYFADMGKLLTGGIPDMVAMQQLYKSNNSEILGPPMK